MILAGAPPRTLLGKVTDLIKGVTSDVKWREDIGGEGLERRARRGGKRTREEMVQISHLSSRKW